MFGRVSQKYNALMLGSGLGELPVCAVLEKSTCDLQRELDHATSSPKPALTNELCALYKVTVGLALANYEIEWRARFTLRVNTLSKVASSWHSIQERMFILCVAPKNEAKMVGNV